MNLAAKWYIMSRKDNWYLGKPSTTSSYQDRQQSNTSYHISQVNYHTIMFDSVKIAWLVALGAAQVAATDLPAFNVNPDSVSVSGLSSGGYMAAQLGVAYSDVFNVGFGVFAGGPYDCARNQYVCALAFVQN